MRGSKLAGVSLIAGLCALAVFGLARGRQVLALAAAADTPTLFQWEDYMDPPFLADYKKVPSAKRRMAQGGDFRR